MNVYAFKPGDQISYVMCRAREKRQEQHSKSQTRFERVFMQLPALPGDGKKITDRPWHHIFILR